MDISIIVPVYNMEAYIKRCLDSIFTQRFIGSFEVIAINDASTDNSLHILKEYQQLTNNLKVLSNDVNKKQAFTRGKGILAASGEYIMNVDADDWILPGTLSTIFDLVKTNDADVISFDIMREDSSGRRRTVNLVTQEICTTNKTEVMKQFLGSACNKMFKRELTTNLLCLNAEANSTEDLLYSLEILIRSRKIYQFPYPYYVYFVNQQSVSWTINGNQYLKNQFAILHVLDKMSQEYPGYDAIFEFVYFKLSNWIIEIVCKDHMSVDPNNSTHSQLIKRLLDEYPLIDRNKAISRSLHGAFFSMFQVYKRSGFGMLGSIIKNSKPSFKALYKDVGHLFLRHT
jgi:glycosyltransferase involved in cell wall biosynthesis